MGLLDFLRKVADSSAPGVISLTGDDEVSVHVYVPSALVKIRKGGEFWADVMPGAVTVREKSCGVVIENTIGERGAVAVSYNGAPFGQVPGGLDCLKDVVRMGRPVRVRMRHDGTRGRGRLAVKALVPDRTDVRHWGQACQMLGEVMPFDEMDGRLLTLNLNEDTVDNLAEGKVDGLSMSFVPVRASDGRTAMPISIRCEAGEITTIGTGYRHYPEIAVRVGDSPMRAVAKRWPSDHGGTYWKLVILYE